MMLKLKDNKIPFNLVADINYTNLLKERSKVEHLVY